MIRYSKRSPADKKEINENFRDHVSVLTKIRSQAYISIFILSMVRFEQLVGEV